MGSNPASSLAASAKVYSYLHSNLYRGRRPVSFRATWSWKPSRTRHVQGVTTHISTSKSNTDWTTDLKKNLDTRGLAPSLIRILFIILQTARAFIRFRITAC